MNHITFAQILTDLPDEIIDAAAAPSYGKPDLRDVQPERAFTPEPQFAEEITAKKATDRAPHWFTAAALAACMLFAVGVGWFLMHGNRGELTTQNSQTDSVQDITRGAVTETTAYTGGTKTTTTQTEAAASQDKETASADLTEDTAEGTALPEDGEADAVTGQTATGTVPRTSAAGERRTDFRGMLGHRSSGLSFYQGQEPDYGQLEIELHLEDQWGTYGHAIGSFSIGSGAHANCYTLDTSEVDPNTPGTYYVYVDTIEGAEDDFDNFSEIPQIGLSRGPIHVTMVKHRTSFMITVMEKRTELQIGNGSGEYTLPLTDRINFFTVYNLWEDNDSAVYTFSDPSVAEITGKNMNVYGCNQVLQIRFLKNGDTTLTVTAADGRTTSCLFHVIPAEEYYIEPEPIVTEAIW